MCKFKYIVCLCLLLNIIAIPANSQALKKSFGLLRSKNYDQASGILFDEERSGPKKPQVLYGLALLYSATDYKNFNPVKAAYYIRDALLAYNKTNKKDRYLLKKEYYLDLKLLNKTKKNISQLAYKVYANEGEYSSLKEFYSLFPEYQTSSPSAKRDWDLALGAQKLNLANGYNPEFKAAYETLIRKGSPKEIAFVALQVLISPKIKKKDWNGAIGILEKYQDLFPNTDNRIQKIILLLKDKEEETPIKSISDLINSSGNNYAPVITSDGKKIYFCGRNRKDNLGKEDIFESEFENGAWNKPALIKGFNSRQEYEAPLSISPDGKIFLTYKNSDILINSRNNDGSWVSTKVIEHICTKEFVEIDASFTPDGKAILFASDREGNYGTFHHLTDEFHGGYQGNPDLYISFRVNDSTWSKPLNLGKNINTPMCERSPFLHHDLKTLYFSSAGHAGLGGLDVFKSTRLSDTLWTQWSEPVNIGKYINTINDDFDFKITADGKNAYFAATANDTVFIAMMKLPEKKKIQLNTILDCLVTDSLTGKRLVANITIENLTDKDKIRTLKTDTSGFFSIIIPGEKLIGFRAEANGYHPLAGSIGNFKLSDTSKHFYQIRMVPRSQDPLFVLENYELTNEPLTITINNLLFDYNLYDLRSEAIPELDRLAAFLKKHPKAFVEISGHTDNTGEHNYNIKLSENRAKSVKNYLIKRGCNEKHFKTIGYGDERPVATNATDEGRQFNRRIEIRLTAEKVIIK